MGTVTAVLTSFFEGDSTVRLNIPRRELSVLALTNALLEPYVLSVRAGNNACPVTISDNDFEHGWFW
jgi:hypothetical protein